MNQGWIKLHRKFLEWEWLDKPEMVSLFIHFLLLANHEKGEWQGQTIMPGQFITGLDSLHKKTKISVQTIRTCITRLISTGEITSKSTNKNRLITLIKYGDYQQDTRKSTSKLNNNQQTTNKQLTANNNKENNNKEDIATKVAELPASEKIPIQDLIGRFKDLNPSFARLYANTSERAALERLVGLHTKEVIEKRIKDIGYFRDAPFCPVITKPTELENKWAKLELFLKKQ